MNKWKNVSLMEEHMSYFQGGVHGVRVSIVYQSYKANEEGSE